MRNNFEAFAPMKCRHQLAPSCVNRTAASLRCKPLPDGKSELEERSQQRLTEDVVHLGGSRGGSS